MKSSDLLKKIDFSCPEEDIKIIKEKSERIIRILKDKIKKNNIKAEVFVGGSFAKNTVIRGDEYDVDIFVRFSEDKKISEKLEKLARKKEFGNVEKIHGSRDYFKIKEGKFVFELIPVKKISKPKDMENITDLSYFHVNYVKRKTNKKIINEIRLAKAFCKAQKTYGAESYVGGFSGYALECLIIYYKTFVRMLKELIKVKKQTIIDPEKKYKRKSDVLINLNQSRLKSPIVLIDPTWKERNVTAGLTDETFRLFQNAARKFLKNPSEEFFKIKKINSESLKKESRKKNFSFAHIKIRTNRQRGDIAGTKMKKFSNFLLKEIGKYFEVKRKEFVYNGEKSADLFVIAKNKSKIIKRGPPIEMKDAVSAFRKANKNAFIKNGAIYVKINIEKSLKGFLDKFKERQSDKIKGMSITQLKISD